MQNPLSTEGNESFVLVGELAAVGLEDRKVPSIFFLLLILILGDPGAVSQVGRKGATNVFKYGRKSPWVPTLTELFPKIQEYDWSLILSISANPRGASKQMKKVYLKGAWVYQPFPVVELKIWYRVNSLPLLLVHFSVHIYCCTRLEISHRFHCAPKQENKNTNGT